MGGIYKGKRLQVFNKGNKYVKKKKKGRDLQQGGAEVKKLHRQCRRQESQA